MSDTKIPVQAPLPPDGLDASENRLESFARIADGWFWETDSEHRFIYMSDSVELITGVKPDWHYGKSRGDIGVPDSVEPAVWHDHLEALDRHQAFANFIFARRGPDGVKWMQTSGKPLFDRYGEFRGYRGIASDITVQIEAERRTETLANAIEQLSDMFVLWGPDDRIVISNRKFKELNRAVIETTEPGTLFETHIRAVMEQNLFPEAVGREEEWIQERLERHKNPRGAFELKRSDGQ